MLTLANQKCTLADFNPRSEIHGEDRQPAADIKLETMLDSTILTMFGPNLRASIYNVDENCSLRNPFIVGALHLNGEIDGMLLTLHRAIGDGEDIKIGGCTVNHFKVEAMESGIVKLSLRVQCHPDETQAGRLYALVQTTVEASLAKAQPELPLGEQK